MRSKNSLTWSRWQSAALEVHVRGSKFGKLEVCDRIVFDLDPGEGVGWKQVVAAAQEVRDRLEAEKLKSFVKLLGGKGVHVVAPIDGAGWDAAKDFTARVASAIAKDSPKLYLAKMTKALRKGRIFIDYLRNTREATSVAAYSTRARPGAPVSMPVSWEALPRTTGGNQFTMLNAKKQLKQNPWAVSAKFGRSCQSDGRIYPASLIRSAFGSKRDGRFPHRADLRSNSARKRRNRPPHTCRTCRHI